MKKYLYIAFMLLVLTSCEKEIPLDYHNVDPLYVAEATITQEGTRGRVTTTQDGTDNSQSTHNVENATVVISCKKFDYTETLKYLGNGNYKSDLEGQPGYTYDLAIDIDGQHFESSSTMQEAPVINSFRFVWKKMLSERFLFADLRVEDTPDKNSYYFMHIYRNGVGYRWAVMTDEKNRNGELQQLFQCTTESDMNDGDSDALRDGDIIRLEVRSIDRLSYDYLYSMQVMDNAGTNPIANYSGGCLGYFSACYVLTKQYIFRQAEVKEEGE